MLFRSGKQIKALSAERGGLLTFDSAEPVELFNPAQDKFVPFSVPRNMDAQGRYAQAIDLMQQWWGTQAEPATEEFLRKELLHTSRELNILIPGTAFIAVENTAQEQALKDAEKKSLNSHVALEFDEYDSPEPGWILLLCLTAPILLWMKKRD